MNKILEELDELIYSGKENPIEISFDITKFFQVINKVREELKRLESIDNANPSEALECLLLETLLERANHDELLFRKETEYCEKFLEENQKYYDTIKQALLKAQEQEKVLSIIWNKKVDLWRLHYSKTLEDYNTYIIKTGGFTITQEEFELLKETLKPQN